MYQKQSQKLNLTDKFNQISKLISIPIKKNFLLKQYNKQECIPVGCVLPTAVAIPGGSPPDTPPWEQTLPDQAPSVDRHMPVNILPCPKLHLRAVINTIDPKQADQVKNKIYQKQCLEVCMSSTCHLHAIWMQVCHPHVIQKYTHCPHETTALHKAYWLPCYVITHIAKNCTF